MTQTTTEPNHAARRERLAAARNAEYVRVSVSIAKPRRRTRAAR